MSWGPILHIFFAKAGCWIRSKRSEWRQQGRGQGTAGVLLLLIVLGISTACRACLAGRVHSWHVFVKLGIESWISSCSCSKYSKPLRIIASHVLIESSNTPNAQTLCFKSARRETNRRSKFFECSLQSLKSNIGFTFLWLMWWEQVAPKYISSYSFVWQKVSTSVSTLQHIRCSNHVGARVDWVYTK